MQLKIILLRDGASEHYEKKEKKTCMRHLKDKLIEFADKDHSSVDKLTEEFAQLAPYFISGGYIKVREDYRVYPTTVEFYFHSEKENGVHDPIVYHRNNNKVEGNIPYFPIFTLHAHDVGYDITFENSKEQYRASVLIREYQILDVRDKQNKVWLKWDSEKQCFCKDKEQNPKNTQVMYLKYILNSFSMGEESQINWIDAKELIEISKNEGKPRVNVPKFEFKKGKFEKIEKGYRKDNKPIYEPCTRPWRFSRKKPIQIN